MDRPPSCRGVRSVENDHFFSEVYTGLPRSSGSRPAFGAVAQAGCSGAARRPARLRQPAPGEGSDRFEYEKPYYAGAQHAPFRPFGDALDNLLPVRLARPARGPPGGSSPAFDGDAAASSTPPGMAAALDRFQARRRLDLITSPQARGVRPVARSRAGTSSGTAAA